MKSFTSLVLFLFVLTTTAFYVVELLPLENKDSIDTYDDDYGEQQDEAKGSEEDEDDEDPDLANASISEGGRIDVVEGSTAILPCLVTNMNGPFVWMKSNKMIFTTNITIGVVNKKLHVAANHSLIIPDVNVAEDQDTYTCQFYNYKYPLNITYQLRVHRKNRVQIDVVPDESSPSSPSSSSSSSKNHHIEIGTSFRLECYAIIVDNDDGDDDGNRSHQQQRIRWFKNGNVLPIEILASHPPRAIFHVPKAERNHSGDYQCLIDSQQAARPLLQAVHVTVLYKPEISVRKTIVNTAVDYEAQLDCEYAGEPQPNVYWIRDGRRLLTDNSNRYEIVHDYRHNDSASLVSLRIRRVHQFDFGAYTCLATNRYGHSNRTILLTQKPAIVASEFEAVTKRFVRWTVESIAPILHSDLSVRFCSQLLWIAANTTGRWQPQNTRNSYTLEVSLVQLVKDLKCDHNQWKFDLNLTVSNQFGSSTHVLTDISASSISNVTSSSGSYQDDRENMIFDQQEIVSTPSSATIITQSATIVISILHVLVVSTMMATSTAILC